VDLALDKFRQHGRRFNARAGPKYSGTPHPSRGNIVVNNMPRPRIANILEPPTLPAAIPAYVIDDGSLIHRFQAGDRDAFTALYRAHHPAIFRFAFHMTADPVKAAEITQDVFVWLIHHAAAFDPQRGALPAFLTGVARRLLQRRQRSERRWLSFDAAEAPQFEARDSTIAIAIAIDAESLRKAIALLPIRYREAIVLCDLESQSYEDAAVAVGCAVGTIRSRLHRGRELLARKFQPKKEIRP
jgi:RNA polymerase sigma-70 factor (ECF subfamily)